MSDDELIFREVDEEVRQDRYRVLWQRYGRYLFAAAAAIVVVTVAVVVWRDVERGAREDASARFVAANALAGSGAGTDALVAFNALAAEAGGGYALLARLREATLLADAGDKAAAVDAYNAIAAARDTPAIYRDLAIVLASLHAIETADPDAVRARLVPLTADDNPWRFTAREVSALAALAAGDRAAARELYQRLADDVAAPAGLRQRAARVLAALGGS